MLFFDNLIVFMWIYTTICKSEYMTMPVEYIILIFHFILEQRHREILRTAVQISLCERSYNLLFKHIVEEMNVWAFHGVENIDEKDPVAIENHVNIRVKKSFCWHWLASDIDQIVDSIYLKHSFTLGINNNNSKLPFIEIGNSEEVSLFILNNLVCPHVGNIVASMSLTNYFKFTIFDML